MNSGVESQKSNRRYAGRQIYAGRAEESESIL
jgi:hypothetical protein